MTNTNLVPKGWEMKKTREYRILFGNKDPPSKVSGRSNPGPGNNVRTFTR